jgi:hypothetical protein
MHQEHMSAAQLRASLAGGGEQGKGKYKRPGPARYKPHKTGQMNDTEAEYLRTVLEPRRATGEILDIRFEEVKFRLADNTYYTPDFFVTTPQGFEVHEVKGRWEDDARVKWKTVADMLWFFLFFAAMKRRKKDGGGWSIEEYGKREELSAAQGSLA